MKWLTTEIDDVIHVIPVDDEQNVLPPHKFDEHCVCNPEVEEWNKKLVIHNSVH